MSFSLTDDHKVILESIASKRGVSIYLIYKLIGEVI